MFGLTRKELAVLKRLNTPQKIQDFLDKLPINFEKKGETCMSVRRVLRERKAHCIEGAFVAAAALALRGQEPLFLDFKTEGDEDHVVALYKQNGHWGAISKTNHAVLRFRDPIYRTPRELALSYFHEYFIIGFGRKSLRSYSLPFSLKPFGNSWVTSEEDLWDIPEAIDKSTHFPLIPPRQKHLIRRVSAFERKISYMAEWTRKNPRT